MSGGGEQEDLFGNPKEPEPPRDPEEPSGILPPPEADWETRISRVRMGSYCGLNRISPMFDDERNEIGYEYHCKHPLHQKPRYCVKTIRWSESRPKKDCFHILATWAHWGKDDRDRQHINTKEEHENAAQKRRDRIRIIYGSD